MKVQQIATHTVYLKEYSHSVCLWEHRSDKAVTYSVTVCHGSTDTNGREFISLASATLYYMKNVLDTL